VASGSAKGRIQSNSGETDRKPAKLPAREPGAAPVKDEKTICQFVRISPTTVRCANCGTERAHQGNPATYVRLCGTAPAASTAQWTPLLTPCVHRREVVEKGVCNVCGMKGQPFEIHACELHGRCMTKRYRNDRPSLKVCLLCDDYEPVAANS
jgi:hypothetical protein